MVYCSFMSPNNNNYYHMNRNNITVKIQVWELDQNLKRIGKTFRYNYIPHDICSQINMLMQAMKERYQNTQCITAGCEWSCSVVSAPILTPIHC